MINNTTIKLREPVIQTTVADDLRLEQTKLEETEFRCWMRATSINIENSVIGQAAVGMYRLRIGGRKQFNVGWFLDAKADGETEWSNYKITRSVPNGYHQDLLLRRID